VSAEEPFPTPEIDSPGPEREDPNELDELDPEIDLPDTYTYATKHLQTLDVLDPRPETSGDCSGTQFRMDPTYPPLGLVRRRTLIFPVKPPFLG